MYGNSGRHLVISPPDKFEMFPVMTTDCDTKQTKKRRQYQMTRDVFSDLVEGFCFWRFLLSLVIKYIEGVVSQDEYDVWSCLLLSQCPAEIFRGKKIPASKKNFFPGHCLCLFLLKYSFWFVFWASEFSRNLENQPANCEALLVSTCKTDRVASIFFLAVLKEN